MFFILWISVRIFFVIFFVRIFARIFDGSLCADFDADFLEFFGNETAGRATNKFSENNLQKILTIGKTCMAILSMYTAKK